MTTYFSAQDAQDILTQNILAFWLRHGMDNKHGGIFTALDRDGTILDTDKSVWFQGRALWTFATSYVQVKQDPAYLEAAHSLSKFIKQHCFDTDGRMFFRVSAEGKPIIKRIRYFFSETFAIIGSAAYVQALQKAGKTEEAEQEKEFTRKLIEKIQDIQSSGVLVPKFNTEHAGSKGFGVPMILLNTFQEVRKAFPEKKAFFTEKIELLLREIQKYFIRLDLQCVLEQCGVDGSFQKDHFEGRLLNPGHAIEGAWFILNEARSRNNDPKLIELGTTMLNWMWEKGWDKEYEGIIYFRDALGKSATEYWHDMKFWWPQAEAAIANLMAYKLTNEEVYKDRYIKVRTYIDKYFVDPEYGEWFGYFHRDGSLSTPLKGNMYKGPFHIPRMYLLCNELLS